MNKIIFGIIISICLLTTVDFAFAQTPLNTDTAFGGNTNQTAETLAGQAGLGTTDFRLVVARIINIALGFLGIIAVALIIYAGFLWMNAAGNETQIELAKKIMTGAAIGLVIILAAFGIAAFVMRVLLGATGGGGGGGGGSPTDQGVDPPGDLPAQFLLLRTEPQNSATNVPRNQTIKFYFNSPVDESSVSDNFTVTKGTNEQITGNISYADNNATIVFIPDGNCETSLITEPVCFSANTEIKAKADGNLKRVAAGSLPVNLNCSNANCEITFTTGVSYDLDLADGASCNIAGVAQCSNNNLLCASDYCASTAGGCVCQSAPIIDWVSPADGARGNLVTIGGRFFGAQPGAVYFKCNSGSNCKNDDEIVQAQLSNTVNSACGNSWTNNIIVAVVPSNAINGPIGVADAQGNYDRTDYAENQRGPNIPDFVINNIRRPGLCRIVGKQQTDNSTTPRQEVQAPIALHGINFGSGTGDNNYANIIFGRDANSYPSLSGYSFNWSPTIIGTEIGGASAPPEARDGPRVPNVVPGLTSVRIKVGTVESNYLPIIVESNARAPFITRIDPSVGHAGDYLTIYGGNFGNTRGSVQFGDKDADFTFPPECSARAIWQDSQIVVKVPAGLIDNRRYTVKVTAGGLDGQLSNGFRFGNYCSHDFTQLCADDTACNSSQTGSKCITAAKPGLCALTPDNGPVSTEVSFYGERFGSVQGSVKFYNNKTAAPSSWTQGQNSTADQAVAAVPTGAVNGPAKVLNNTNIESNPLNFRVGSCLTAGASGTDNPACSDNTQPYCCGAATQFAGSCLANADACGLVPSRTYAQYYFEFSTQATGVISCDGNIAAPSCQADPTLCQNQTLQTWCNPTTCACEVPRRPAVVVECNRQEGQCATANLPSPAPLTPNWDTGRNPSRPLTCTNAVITARFTQRMQIDTLNNNNIKVYNCGINEDSHASPICDNDQLITGAITSGETNNNSSYFSFTPSANLTPNNWYKVDLKTTNGIKSADTNLYLLGGGPAATNDSDSGYVWYFKTRDSNTQCNVGCVTVVPVEYTASRKNEQISYHALPDAEDNACVMLKGAGYNWGWQSSDSSKADISIDYYDKSKATTTALTETASGTPVRISATEPTRQKRGEGELEIIFGFNVVNVWPINNCTDVCRNAGIGARFSSAVAQDSLTGHAQLSACVNPNTIAVDAGCEDWRSAGDVQISRGGLDNNEIILSISQNSVPVLLEPNKLYKVTLTGGQSGLKSEDGSVIDNPNEGQNYGWQFITGNRVCEVTNISIEPAVGITKLVGATVAYQTTPSNNEVLCSGSTQRLAGQNYDWTWKPPQVYPNAPEYDLVAFIPPTGQSLRTHTVVNLQNQSQPYTADQQSAEARGAGTVQNDNTYGQSQQTNVKASVETGASIYNQMSRAEGQANFVLQCGFRTDNECRDTDNTSLNNTYGVGTNTCCYPRPYVVSSTPAHDNGTVANVCRNALVTVDFNEPMDIASFNNNVVVAAKYGSDPCPENWQYLLLADSGKNLGIGHRNWVSDTLTSLIARITNVITRLPLVGKIFNASSALATDYGSNWCVVPGSLGGSNQAQADSVNNVKGIATFAPRALLKAGGEHLILIKGDNDLISGTNTGGVKNAFGVSIGVPSPGYHGVICRGNDSTQECKINGQPFYGQLIKFTALPDGLPNGADNNHGICAADRVTLTPPSHLFTTNQNNTGDDTIEAATNQDFPDRDKLFTAEAMSSSGQKIVSIDGVYSWNWAWSTDNEAVARVGEKLTNDIDPNKAIIFTNTTTRSSTFARAAATIDDNIYTIGNGQPVTGAAQIWVMLCNNPWPAYQEAWRPWQDRSGNCRDTGTCLNTNFEFYYCRDKGSASFNDDLPVLDDNGAILGQDNTRGVLKEFLFTQPAAPAAPQLRVYTGLVEDATDTNGDRVVDNDVNNDSVVDVFDTHFVFIRNRILDRTIVLNNGETIIMWSSSFNAPYYRIYQAQGNNSWSAPQQINSSSLTCGNAGTTDIGCYFKISNLQNDIPYRFVVTALKVIGINGNNQYNQYLESAFSNAVTVTPRRTVSPAPPTNLTPTMSGNAVTLSWTKSSDNEVTAYKVYRGIGADANHEVRSVGNVNTYTWQNLAANRNYYFRVSAVAGEQESAESNVIRINLGPIGHWKLDRTSVSYNATDEKFVIRDFGVFNIAGSINSSDSDRLEWPNNALGFRHNEYAINIPSSAGLNLSQSSGFTQSVWIKPDITFNTAQDNADSSYFGVLGYQAESGAQFRYPSIYAMSNGKIHAGFGTGGNSGKWCNIFTANSVLEKDKWYFVGLTYDKNTSEYKVYINNQPSLEYQPNNTDGSLCVNNYPYAVNNLTIGKVGDDYFQGSIAEVKMYNYVRAPEQIQAEYNSAKARFGVR